MRGRAAAGAATGAAGALVAASVLLTACSSAHQHGDGSSQGDAQGGPTQLGRSATMHMPDGGAQASDLPDGVGTESRSRLHAVESQVWVGELREFLPAPECDVDVSNRRDDQVSGIAVVLSVDLNADGQVISAGMTFGGGGPPLTPTDEPLDAWVHWCVWTPFGGFTYVGHDIEDDGERLTLGINALDVYGVWCAEQQPLAVDDARAEESGLQYACRTYAADHQYDPVHHRFDDYADPYYDYWTSLPDQLCYPWSDVICRCTAQGCRIAQHLLYVDLLRIGDTMDGTLPNSGGLSTLDTPRLLLQRVQ